MGQRPTKAASSDTGHGFRPTRYSPFLSPPSPSSSRFPIPAFCFSVSQSHSFRSLAPLLRLVFRSAKFPVSPEFLLLSFAPPFIVSSLFSLAFPFHSSAPSILPSLPLFLLLSFALYFLMSLSFHIAPCVPHSLQSVNVVNDNLSLTSFTLPICFYFFISSYSIFSLPSSFPFSPSLNHFLSHFLSSFFFSFFPTTTSSIAFLLPALASTPTIPRARAGVRAGRARRAGPPVNPATGHGTLTNQEKEGRKGKPKSAPAESARREDAGTPPRLSLRFLSYAPFALFNKIGRAHV